VQELGRQKANVVELLEAMKQLTNRFETLQDENAALHCTIDIHLAALHRDKENGEEEEMNIKKLSKIPVSHEHNITLTVQGGKLIQTKPKVLKFNPDFLGNTRKLAL
jgi:allophanate hydrolase subunit 1